MLGRPHKNNDKTIQRGKETLEKNSCPSSQSWRNPKRQYYGQHDIGFRRAQKGVLNLLQSLEEKKGCPKCQLVHSKKQKSF